MKSINLRPRCKLDSPMSVEQAMDCFLTKLRRPSEEIRGSILLQHAYLKIKDENQHYWSPELHITVEETENGCLIRGVAGPKPKIWTMFMFFYSAVVVLLVFGSAMGVSQWSLNMDAPWLWSIPAAIFAWLSIIGAAKYGQHKGNSQLILLNDYMYAAIAEGEAKLK